MQRWKVKKTWQKVSSDQSTFLHVCCVGCHLGHPSICLGLTWGLCVQMTLESNTVWSFAPGRIFHGELDSREGSNKDFRVAVHWEGAPPPTDHPAEGNNPPRRTPFCYETDHRWPKGCRLEAMRQTPHPMAWHHCGWPPTTWRNGFIWSAQSTGTGCLSHRRGH